MSERYFANMDIKQMEGRGAIEYIALHAKPVSVPCEHRYANDVTEIDCGDDQTVMLTFEVTVAE